MCIRDRLCRTLLSKHLCNSTSETTYDGVLLNCEHSSCLLSCLSDDILIDRLQLGFTIIYSIVDFVDFVEDDSKKREKKIKDAVPYGN